MGIDPTRVDAALREGRRWLAQRARQGFPDTQHVMHFPRAAGFSANPERQCGDGFTRCVLAGVLLDLAELGDPMAELWRDIARGEADRIAAARTPHLQGGWRYFPQLPELPPDLDSLGAAIALFARIAPQHLPLAAGPIALALASRRAGGEIGTWLIGPQDDAELGALMQGAIEQHWGDTLDIEVNARFHAALAMLDLRRWRDDIERGIELLLHHRTAAGDWAPTWYTSRAYATELALPLLRRSHRGQRALREALAASIKAWPHSAGGADSAQEAALNLNLWLQPEAAELGDASPSIDAAIDTLLRTQAERGSWTASSWICMDIGRASGAPTRRLFHQSDALTTAWCLRALQGWLQRH